MANLSVIKGSVKNYDWGNSFFIPSLIGGYDGRPQAEYWMGTHKKGEAVFSDGTLLSSVCGNLPFLFKILAIAKPLSIQCHPDKKQAVEGYLSDKVNYADDNGKPEEVCALTDVTARCGIKKGVSEEEVIDVLINHQNDMELHLDRIMNTVVLKKGQAMYIKPGTLHQYISGCAVELMAASDNVLRAGMTSKHVDIPALRKIACFKSSEPSLLDVLYDRYGRRYYNAPCDDFRLSFAENGTFDIDEEKNTIAFVLDGNAEADGNEYVKGQCIFIPAGSRYTINCNGTVYFAS